jgi:tetratricopeptide (TPR) repeat protein
MYIYLYIYLFNFAESTLKTHMMNFKKLFLFCLVVFIASSCSVSKKVNTLTADAQSLFVANEYEKAFIGYNEIIDFLSVKNKKIDGAIYRNAGICAYEIQQNQKAIDYIEKAKSENSANGYAYLILAKAYLKVDNLSREIVNLEAYLECCSAEQYTSDVRKQLFLAYVKSENWDLANKIWPILESRFKEDIDVMLGYLVVCTKLALNDEIVPWAKKIVKVDAYNTEALKALGIFYYNIAEDSYQVEMKAYEKNRTNAQYKKLLSALEVINENFKVSRDYFERLFKLDPNPKYANYLGNIYTRFDNKQKADFYYKKAKQ